MITIRGYNKIRPGRNQVLSIEKVDTVPVEEPVILQEAKNQLKVDFSDSDTMIAPLIATARKMLEKYTGLSLVLSTVTVVIEYGRLYELPYGPYLNTFVFKDTEDTVIDAADYELKGTGASKSLYYNTSGEYTMTYSAGYTPATIPEALKQAILYYIEYLYDPSEEGKKAKEKAEQLANSYKKMTWLI